MYAVARKLDKENKSRAVANNVCQNKSNEKQVAGFVDNRLEAVTQRKLKKIGKKSSSMKQLRVFQEMANTSLQTKKATQLQANNRVILHRISVQNRDQRINNATIQLAEFDELPTEMLIETLVYQSDDDVWESRATSRAMRVAADYVLRTRSQDILASLDQAVTVAAQNYEALGGIPVLLSPNFNVLAAKALTSDLQLLRQTYLMRINHRRMWRRRLTVAGVLGLNVN